MGILICLMKGAKEKGSKEGSKLIAMISAHEEMFINYWTTTHNFIAQGAAQ